MYDYRCEACKAVLRDVKVSMDADYQCPKCGNTATRIPAAIGFKLKGIGWARDRYMSIEDAMGYDSTPDDTVGV
jgi:putative FmdB family regulatory protein